MIWTTRGKERDLALVKCIAALDIGRIRKYSLDCVSRWLLRAGVAKIKM